MTEKKESVGQELLELLAERDLIMATLGFEKNSLIQVQKAGENGGKIKSCVRPTSDDYLIVVILIGGSTYMRKLSADQIEEFLRVAQ